MEQKLCNQAHKLWKKRSFKSHLLSPQWLLKKMQENSSSALLWREGGRSEYSLASAINSYKLLVLIVVTNNSIKFYSFNSFSNTVVLGEMRHLTSYGLRLASCVLSWRLAFTVLTFSFQKIKRNTGTLSWSSSSSKT